MILEIYKGVMLVAPQKLMSPSLTEREAVASPCNRKKKQNKSSIDTWEHYMRPIKLNFDAFDGSDCLYETKRWWAGASGNTCQVES